MKVIKGEEKLTLGYGWQNFAGGYNHKGVDIVERKKHTAWITSLESGTILGVRTNVKGYLHNSYGNWIEVDHGNGYVTFYAHLAYGTIKVKKGDRVKKGQVLGYMGKTGWTDGGEHLHFEIYRNGKRLDPTPYVFGTAEIFPKQTKKSINQIAKEVIDGKWGNGQDRKTRITNAGYNYSLVQNEVNRILLDVQPKKSINTLVREVLAGKWGNGVDRKNRLTKAGYDYYAIQKRINEIL